MCDTAELRSAAGSVDRLRATAARMAPTLHHRAEDDSDIRLRASEARSVIPPRPALYAEPVVESLQIPAILVGAWLPYQFYFL